MAIRPSLSENSFLNFLFHPKKAAQPTGLRKTTLKGTKGHSRRRLNAFNRMTSVQQEVLKRSGQRDAYLRGETTLGKAKQALRPKAIQLGITKPVKPRRPKTGPFAGGHVLTPLDIMIARHVREEVVDAGRPFNVVTSTYEMQWLEADSGMMTWTYGDIKYAGRKGSEYEIIEDGRTHNPFWYH